MLWFIGFALVLGAVARLGLWLELGRDKEALRRHDLEDAKANIFLAPLAWLMGHGSDSKK